MDPQTKSARRAARHLDLGLAGPGRSHSHIYYQGYALPVPQAPEEAEPVPGGSQKRPSYPAAA